MAEGEEQDEAQKTEEPTAKRLEESRKKGQVPLSREMNNWMMLFAGTVLVATLFGPVMLELTHILRAYIAQADNFPDAAGGMEVILGEGTKKIMLVLAFPLGALFLAGFISPFIQIGPLFAPEAIKPQLSKISPLKGFKRLFSSQSLMEFAKGIFKLCIITLIAVLIVYPYFGNVEHLIGLPMSALMSEIKVVTLRALAGMLVVLLVIAVIDLVYQRQQHYKKMRMTKQEVKDEYKQSEGDPHVKGKLRQLRAERARQRMMQSVPDADVVITNPTHYSIALKYDPDTMEAPTCLAKGVDEVALRIREVAKEHKITLYENKPLARALFDTVEIDETVPEDHYQAVAEVISYVFRLKGKLKT